MKNGHQAPHLIHSIAALNQALGLPEPQHPLVSLNDYGDIKPDSRDWSKGIVMDLYKISYKKKFTGKVRYGQQYYDFDAGGLCFFAPNQLIGATAEPDADYGGFSLVIHPDFLRNYPLGKNIRNYGFFSYATSEALHLSEKERETITGVFNAIREELETPIDLFSQDVIIAQIELLLHYSNRFYNRQFITRKAANHDLLTQLEDLLADYFDTDKALTTGLPTVQFISEQMHVSQRYLSDMLRTLTGQNTQQHIHNKLIEKAKEILAATNLSVAEIAYQLGFEHPQSFNKMFKQKTLVSPVKYRQSLS